MAKKGLGELFSQSAADVYSVECFAGFCQQIVFWLFPLALSRPAFEILDERKEGSGIPKQFEDILSILASQNQGLIAAGQVSKRPA